MFVVTEVDAAARLPSRCGRWFPGIADNKQARECAAHHRRLEAAAYAPGKASGEGATVTSVALMLAAVASTGCRGTQVGLIGDRPALDSAAMIPTPNNLYPPYERHLRLHLNLRPVMAAGAEPWV